MEYFAGLDISVKETSVCIIDAIGKVVQEAKPFEYNRDTTNAPPVSAETYIETDLPDER